MNLIFKIFAIIIIMSLFCGCSIGDINYYDKSYVDKIEIEWELIRNINMTYDGYVYDSSKNSKILKNNNALYLLKIKNTGNKYAWGEIVVEFDGNIIAKIEIHGMTPNMKDNLICIIPIDTKSLILKASRIKNYWGKLSAK